MCREDLEFASSITDAMSWDLSTEDFEYMLEMEPRGCFVLLDGSEKIGVATTARFGRIGWLGNVIVDERLRGRGGGSVLVKHAVEYLRGVGAATIGIYGYVERIPFYTRLGFEYDSSYIYLQGTVSGQPLLATARKMEEGRIRETIELDSQCFGADRRRLLEPILQNPANPCYFLEQQGEIVGYVAARRYEEAAELGPLACRRDTSAAQLVRSVLSQLEGYQVSVCVSEEEDIVLQILRGYGLSETFRVARMFHGAKPVISECVYIPESMERG